MTARELAHSLRTVRLTNDVTLLQTLAHRAHIIAGDQRDDATETLLWAIAEKVVRLARLN